MHIGLFTIAIILILIFTSPNKPQLVRFIIMNIGLVMMAIFFYALFGNTF